MKDAYEVLYKKEAELDRVRKEIDSLHLTAKLLADSELGLSDDGAILAEQERKPVQSVSASEVPPIELPPSVAERPGFWSSFRRRR